MGWVSMSEDIDEIRQQRAYFERGLASVKKWVTKSKSSDLKHAEKAYSDLSNRIDDFLNELQSRVLRVFEDAERRLNDPNVRICCTFG